jgi:hypothetical protein
VVNAVVNSDVNETFIDALLNRPEAEVRLTEEVIITAAKRGNIGTRSIEHILGRMKTRLHVTPKMLEAVIENPHDTKLLELLAEQPGTDLPITGQTVKTALRQSGGTEKIRYIHDSKQAVASLSEGAMELFAATGGMYLLGLFPGWTGTAAVAQKLIRVAELRDAISTGNVKTSTH